MAHPQNNFTSQFQSNSQTGNAALTLNVNGENHVYTPQGSDQTVSVIEPVVFEMSGNPTYSEINEVVGQHIPCFIHVSGVGTDYMIPYVGQSNGGGKLYFAMVDAQTEVVRYWICNNGAPWSSGSIGLNTYTAGANINIDANNVISATDTTYNVFTSSTNGLVPKANDPGDDAKFLRGDHTWQAPMTGVVGDENHPNYISVDSDGNLHYAKTKRLFWEFTFQDPSVELTATDISNGFVELIFPLGADRLGLQIMYNGNMVCMKGYGINMGNPLNGRQLSFYILSHSGTSPRWLMDTGFETYTEYVVNNYDWKAFKAIGLCADHNTSLVDAVLRVPLTTEVAGETFRIPGYITVSVFGVANGD